MLSTIARLCSYRHLINASLIAILLGGIRFGPGAVLLAEEPAVRQVTPRQHVTATGTVGALVSSRERLRSGEARAHWTWKTKKYKESTDWHLYFDYDKGLSRVDRRVINDGHRIIRVDTPVESLNYVPASDVISRLPPGAPALAHGYVFDVRTTGLAALISIKGNAATWPAFLAMVERDGRPTLHNEADGKRCVTWRSLRVVGTPNGQGQRELYAEWAIRSLTMLSWRESPNPLCEVAACGLA